MGIIDELGQSLDSLLDDLLELYSINEVLMLKLLVEMGEDMTQNLEFLEALQILVIQL